VKKVLLQLLLFAALSGSFSFAMAGEQIDANCYPWDLPFTDAEYRTKEHALRIQAEVVAEAAEAYLADHNGVLPNTWVLEWLTDYLPGMETFENPYGGSTPNPIEGTAMNWGDIGVQPVDVDADGVNESCVVTAYGFDLLVFIPLGPLADEY